MGGRRPQFFNRSVTIYRPNCELRTSVAKASVTLIAMKRILFASIVPFWNRSTGAEQRIYSLVRVLEDHGWHVRTFFPGHAANADQEQATRLKLDVVFANSSQAPIARSLQGRIKWQIAAVANAISSFFLSKKSETQNRSTDDRQPQRLQDFQWPWASEAFNEMVAEFSPAVIVCEYITMSYLVAGLPESVRKSVHCLVDTHDVLSKRQQQFDDHKRAHWLDVSMEEETDALRQFDTIIAIQPAEAQTFRNMLPSQNVIVVGHHPVDADEVAAGGPNSQFKRESKSNASQPFTLGYLGSNNASNVDAISGFLKTVWSQFKDDDAVELLIAGDVCDGISWESQFSNVRRLGKVAEVSDFYNSVDAVVNPVGYGTGLKIKSVEAIAFGCPLLCTAGGWCGDAVLGVVKVNELPEMVDTIQFWKSDAAAFEALKRSIVETDGRAAESLKEGCRTAYGELLSLLDGLAQ